MTRSEQKTRVTLARQVFLTNKRDRVRSTRSGRTVILHFEVVGALWWEEEDGK
jgi:hypothetical protein